MRAVAQLYRDVLTEANAMSFADAHGFPCRSRETDVAVIFGHGRLCAHVAAGAARLDLLTVVISKS
jgi:hypothetical protein